MGASEIHPCSRCIMGACYTRIMARPVTSFACLSACSFGAHSGQRLVITTGSRLGGASYSDPLKLKYPWISGARQACEKLAMLGSAFEFDWRGRWQCSRACIGLHAQWHRGYLAEHLQVRLSEWATGMLEVCAMCALERRFSGRRCRQQCLSCFPRVGNP